jgi:hypothetical protein
MTVCEADRYCPLFMGGWQSNAAFVVQFRDDTDFTTGRIEGKVEHIASYTAARFNSVEELIAFMARVLSDLRRTEQR